MASGRYLILAAFIVLTCCDLSGVTLVQGAEQSATWDISTKLSKKGESITLTCTVQGAGFFDIVRISKESEEEGDVSILSDKEDIREPFLSTGRFTVVSDRATARTLTLTITDAQEEDTGIYTCGKVSNAGNTPVARVNVKVNVATSSLCPSWCDYDGYYHGRLQCYNREFCCGSKSYRYCCLSPDESLNGTYEDVFRCEKSPYFILPWQASIGALSGILLILIIASFCCRVLGNLRPDRHRGRRSACQHRNESSHEMAVTTIISERPSVFDPEAPYAFEPPAYDSVADAPPKYADIYGGPSGGQDNLVFTSTRNEDDNLSCPPYDLHGPDSPVEVDTQDGELSEERNRDTSCPPSPKSVSTIVIDGEMLTSDDKDDVVDNAQC